MTFGVDIPFVHHLGFELVLIGRAIDYLPYFLMSFQELGRAGVGRRSRPGRAS